MFIPVNDIEVGDRVKAKFQIDTMKGTFTEGHEFIVTEKVDRGWDLVDDEGRGATEVPNYMIEKIRE